VDVVDYIYIVLVATAGLNAIFGIAAIIDSFSKKKRPFDEAHFESDYTVMTQVVFLMCSCIYLGHFLTKNGVENISLLSFDLWATVIGIIGNVLNFRRIEFAYALRRSARRYEEYLKENNIQEAP
jgi:hypothetical protein